MPRQPTATESRVSKIISALEPAITLLEEINDAFGTPFVQAISNTTHALITAVQVMNAKIEMFSIDC